MVNRDAASASPERAAVARASIKRAASITAAVEYAQQPAHLPWCTTSPKSTTSDQSKCVGRFVPRGPAPSLADVPDDGAEPTRGARTSRRRRLSTSFASVRGTSPRVYSSRPSSSKTPTPGRRSRISHPPRGRRPRRVPPSRTANARPPPPPRPSRASATGMFRPRPPRETRGSAPSPTPRLVRLVARRPGARREAPPLNSPRAAGCCTSPRSW